MAPKPQRRTARYWLLQLHLWIGLILMLPLVMMGITGAILVYAHDIEHLLGQGDPTPKTAGEWRSPSELIEAAKAATKEPGRIPIAVRWPIEVGEPAAVRLSRPGMANERPQFRGGERQQGDRQQGDRQQGGQGQSQGQPQGQAQAAADDEGLGAIGIGKDRRLCVPRTLPEGDAGALRYAETGNGGGGARAACALPALSRSACRLKIRRGQNDGGHGMNEPLIEIKGLAKSFPIHSGLSRQVTGEVRGSIRSP